MGLAEVKADAKLRGADLSKASTLEGVATLDQLKAWLRAELVDNVYPMFEGVVAAVQEDIEPALDELAEAVDELMDQADEILHPPSAAKIIGVFELGKALAVELEALIARADDVTRKRVGDLIKLYRQSAEVASEMVAGFTLDPEEPASAAEPEDGATADDGDDEDEDDGDAKGGEG